MLCVWSIQAIVIRHDREDGRYLLLGRQFPSVCRMNLPDGAGTLIAPCWILTAAHVALDIQPGHTIWAGDRSFTVDETFIHPDYIRSRHDIALIKLRTPVLNILPVQLYREKDEKGRRVILVGAGKTGTGLTGPVKEDGRMRGAYNQVDDVNKAWIMFRFDEPTDALDLEGISGPGDSGGPAFIQKEGTLFVAGISAIQSFASRGLREGCYGVMEYYTRVSSYLPWLEALLNPPQELF